MRFSEREGFVQPKVIQVGSMDNDLRNSLWNLIQIFYLDRSLHDSFNGEAYRPLMRKIWNQFLKWPLDNLPSIPREANRNLKRWFDSVSFYEVYDLIEFLPGHIDSDLTPGSKFRELCNIVLAREVSGYRFLGKRLAPVTNETEIKSIEDAIAGTLGHGLDGVRIHLDQALALFSDRQNPDYRNAIKEAISAVETLCRLISGDPKATLGKALNVVEQKVPLHKSLKQSLSALYGYTSDEQGIRHSLMDEPDLGPEDASFLIVSCSAFINYLQVKAAKAGAFGG